jgi:hypothetical protein
LPRRYRPLQGWRRAPLTPPVAPRGHSETRAPSRNQDRLPRHPVKDGGFTGPERLPSTECSRSVRFRARSVCESPPPVFELCRSSPASGAVSRLRCSRMEGLDPSSFPVGSSPAGAMGRASPVDFCNPNAIREHDLESYEPHAPFRRSPAGTALFVGGYAGPGKRSFRHPHRSAANRKFTGQRSSDVENSTFPRAATPPIAIARGGSFAPTRSTRTPLVASS